MVTGTAPTDIRGARQASQWAHAASLLQRQGALLALVAILAFGVQRYGENFYSEYNVTSMLSNNSYFGLIALGMTFVIMTGGIDLSVGSVVAMAAVISARVSPHGLYWTVAAAIGAGLVV